jgi:hypothetical protein
MNLRERILNREYDYLPNPLELFDPLVQIRAEILEPLRRHLINESPQISRLYFSEESCQKHYNSFVSKIHKSLRNSRLENYKLHCGKAFYTVYTGSNFSSEKEISEDVFEIRNKQDGLKLQFRIIGESVFGSAIHVLFLIRETKHQGSFFEIKRMLVEELWKQVLEVAGFAFLYGRAILSSNSEIRHNCPRANDWRESLCYVGLNDELEPILIPGIRLFYYRLGFVQMRLFSDEFSHEYVALLSASTAKKIKESIGDQTWQEINRYSHANAKIWSEIVVQRESRLEADELEKRITAKRSKMSASNR